MREKTYVLRNKSFTYILPMIGNSAKEFTNLSACYIGDSSRPELKNKILLLYDTTKPWFDALDDWLQSLPDYTDYYQVNDRYTMYVFDPPENQMRNYILFKQGKYSLFDDEYKREILWFLQELYNDVTHIRHVLYRAEEKYEQLELELDVVIDRTAEVSSIPDMNREMFNAEMIRENSSSKNISTWE